MKQLFFLLCCLICGSLRAQPYDLNDPRNPDCPCHKYQRQAEREFARANQNKDRLMPVGERSGDNAGAAVAPEVTDEKKTSGGRAERSAVAKSARLKKRKRRDTAIDDWKFRFCRGWNGLQKMRTDYSVCYKW